MTFGRIFRALAIAATALVALSALLVVGILLYSVLWMRPRADYLSKEFTQAVSVGDRIETIHSKAEKAGADYVWVHKPTGQPADKLVLVSFYTFPGGLSRVICRVPIESERAVSVGCSQWAS